MIKSPVSTIGGKYFLRDFLNAQIPEHKVFCEAFAGAGHLLFHKQPADIEILNDINNDLICFYRVIQNQENRERLINILNGFPFARKTFNDISRRWKLNDRPCDDILRAGEWFYLSRSCFSADFERGGFATPSVSGRNPAKTFRNLTDSLEGISKRLRFVTFENLDYSECIQRFDSKNTLFYCDPPYLDTEFYYQKGCFKNEDHYKLADMLHQIKGKAMITHYENDTYDELYKDWNRFDYETFKVSRGITKTSKAETRPRATEVLYCNF